MASIQQKIVPKILDLIRTRRKAQALQKDSGQGRSSEGAAPARCREALFSDFRAVADLKHRSNMAADSFENWERLWRRNPALEGTERPIGWVVESEGKVVGYMGNISLLYRYGAQTLTAVTAHGLSVEPQYRAFGVSMIAAFYSQKNVDLHLTTTAIPEVGRIAKGFRSDALPQPDYETVLFWVLKPRSFAQVVMEKLELRPSLARIGGLSASLAVRIDKLLHRRWPRRSQSGLTVSEMAVTDVGEDFQSLWIEKLGERTRLFADRSPEMLRWHFEVPGDRGSARVICCWRNGELVGYAVVRNDPQPNGLLKSLVADMLARHDDPQVVQALMVAAYDHAKRSGSYLLEVLGFPAGVRRVCLQWNPCSRKYPACPFYYRAADPVLHKALLESAAWYATPFDGDTTLIRPSFSSSPSLFATENESAADHGVSDPSEVAIDSSMATRFTN